MFITAETYWCNEISCKYKDLSTHVYIICTDCYERDDNFEIGRAKLYGPLTISMNQTR